MKKSVHRVHLDFARQTATVRGRPLQLQDKAWHVLSLLATEAPGIVCRETLISAIWSGNHLIGERGLNQALWAIRSELGDDARDPVYIRTLPREGYQWLQNPVRQYDRKRRVTSAISIAASVCVIAIVAATLPVNSSGESVLPAQCDRLSKENVQAYQVERDVFIDIQDGCRLIVKPSGTKEFGPPIVSDNGKHVAFTITEEQSCRFVSFALQDGTRTEYDQCFVAN